MTYRRGSAAEPYAKQTFSSYMNLIYAAKVSPEALLKTEKSSPNGRYLYPNSFIRYTPDFVTERVRQQLTGLF